MRYVGVLVGVVSAFILPLLFTRRRLVHWLLYGLGFAVCLLIQFTFNTSVIR